MSNDRCQSTPTVAGTAEAGTADAGTADAGTADAGTADAGTAGPIYHLGGAAGQGLRAAVTLGQGLPGSVSGLPAHYYWKDAIRVGTYAHPSGRYTLGITRESLDGYAAAFAAMRKNGVGVPILMDHAPTAAATLGWIVAVKRDGDRLMELHQFLGDGARDTGLRNHVSLGIDPDYVDGRSVRYGAAIVHSAVTPVPVVPGQGEFEPLELANGTRPVVALARVPDPAGNDTPPPAVVPPPVFPNAQRLTPKAPPAPDVTLSLLTNAAAARRDLAVAAGGLAPHVADRLMALLVPTAGAAAAAAAPLLLARTGVAGDGPPLALAVFDLLAGNRPVTLGEVTGGQRLHALSRLVPVGDGGDETVGREDVRRRMIDLASGR